MTLTNSQAWKVWQIIERFDIVDCNDFFRFCLIGGTGTVISKSYSLSLEMVKILTSHSLFQFPSSTFDKAVS